MRAPRSLTRTLLLAVALADGSSAQGANISFPLVQDGKAVANVVVGGDNPDLLAAVDDLARYVRQITGAELNIVHGAKDLPGSTLHIGETELFPHLSSALPKIKVDGFAMAAFGDDLLLAGSIPQGTANGVAALLQDQFGVRWYAPGPLWEVVPHRGSLSIFITPNHDSFYIENPALYGRTVWGKIENGEFARRMRLTLPGVKLPYVGAGHSLAKVVPTEKYAAKHPDYFCMVNGKRQLDSKPHPCFTHPDMFDVFMAYVRDGGISFGVNDNPTTCQCERCQAIDGKAPKYMGMPTFSETFCRLMARVAAQTAKEFPDRRLGIFAYQQTDNPPQTVDRIGDNVDVVLCQDTSQHFDPDVQRMDFDNARQWIDKTGNVSFYGYVGINYWTPRYFPTLLAQHMRYMKKAGLRGWRTHASTMIDSSMPMIYLMYQMMWKPDVDDRALIEQMLTDLYGAAAPAMRQFYDHWEQCWMRQKTGHWFKGMDDFAAEMEIYSAADIARGRELLNQAAALADDDTGRQRVQWISDRYSWTELAAKAQFVSLKALQSPLPEKPKDVLAMSAAVAQAWQALAEEVPKARKLEGVTPGRSIDKPFSIRAWGLKQQMRDAAIAPLLRWDVAHEQQLAPARLKAIEAKFAQAALAARQTVEAGWTTEIKSNPRPPRADGLRVATVPKLSHPISLGGASDDWSSIPYIDSLPWVFRARSDDESQPKYEEPAPPSAIAPPDPQDQSMTWQAAWDPRRLYLRIVVTDDIHKQDQVPVVMWKEDALQIALDPDHGNYPSNYYKASYNCLIGGYKGNQIEFNICLHSAKTEMVVSRRPKSLQATDVARLIEAKVARHGTQTVYEAAVDWTLLQGFNPQPRKSLGISLVVNDIDGGIRRSAEYGGGVIHTKRPSEFAAIRLGD